ncbi:50S ribosomal protein L25 [Blattabacterium cuenoti]|uniref:50S ribosomal protein L25 n=1 Tax=Blattabacterium cuenoti TaxID=1653831 RepID=UPI00293BE72E|nr:50S ribosomal protein L25 [Blattabacterium cuenoti]
MMHQYVNIYGKKRRIGKKAIHTIRLSGGIPCVLYGKNVNIPFWTSLEKNLKKLVYTSEVCWVSIQIEGYDKNINAVQKEIQFDPISEKILHVDFCQIEESKPITLEIPVKTFGRPIGVSKGGEYHSPIRTLKVKAIPSYFPKYINLDISKLDIGDKIKVKDLSLTKEYTILHPLNTLLARVNSSRAIIKEKETQEEKEIKTQEKENRKIKK